MTPTSPAPVLVQGQGQPVLLIHGSASDRIAWMFQMDTLSEHFKVIAYDRPGSLARPSAEPWTVEKQADDALHQLGLQSREPAWICGASFGSLVGLDLAHRYPQKVRGVILCEPPLPVAPYATRKLSPRSCELYGIAQKNPEFAAWEFVQIVVGEKRAAALPAATRKRISQNWTQIKNDSWASARYAWPPKDPKKFLHGKPALILNGSESPIFFRDASESVARLLGAQTQEIAGAGHTMQVDAPTAFDAALRSFIAKSR